MTGENPVSCLAQFVYINLYVYLKTGLNWPDENQLKLVSRGWYVWHFLYHPLES